MRFFIRAIKRGGHHVDKILTRHQLSIGWGDDQDIKVYSLRIGLCHAVIDLGEDGNLRVRAITPIGILHNGQTVTQSKIKLGDTIEIGNWLRTIPLVSDVTWNSRPISRSHRAFGNDCTVCHEKAFVSVRDSACAKCHKAMPHHIEADSKQAKDFKPSRCAACHKQHTDKQTFVPRDEGFCIDCHRQINQQSPNTHLLNVSGFGEKHPEFRATLIGFHDGQETASRISLGQKTELKEHSNLEFSHKGHLDKT